MYRSYPLVQNFAKQGLKIRIRKESGPRPSRYTQSSRRKDLKRKSIELISQNNTSEEEEDYEEQEDEEGLTPMETTTEEEPIIPPPPPPISNKRRLSLSYLLDNTATNEDDIQLAPIKKWNYYPNKKIISSNTII